MNDHSFIQRKYLLMVLLGLLLAVAVGPRLVQASPSAYQELQAVWQRVHQSGGYIFSARMTQTLTPRPTLINAGRGSQTTQVHMEGQTDLDANSLRLTMWTNGGSVLDPESGIQMKVEDGEAFIRQGSGPWQKSEDVTGLFAPDGDFLSYLEVAKNVERHEPQLLDTVGGRVLVTRYTFDVDGRRFAEKMRAKMLAQAGKEGLPHGLQFELPRVYVDMTGQGELWVGANGLPLRQSFTLNFPEREDNYLPVIDATIDFSEFDSPPIATFMGQATYLGNNLIQSVLRIEFVMSMVAGMLTMLFTAALILRRRSRLAYATLALTVIVSMLISPLLNSGLVYAYGERLAKRQYEQDLRRAELEAQATIQAELEEPSITPHTPPLALAEATARVQATVNATNEKYFDPSCSSDPDGDLDGDGLTNLQECLLGTLPTDPDTDSDLVSDYVEVTGFQAVNSDGAMVTWYTDPLNPDTNRDGLDDGTEWYLNGEFGTLPIDSDGDGEPDLWDLDNDGDGVPDAYDISPYSSSGHTAAFNKSAPFQLDMHDLMPGKLVKVQFQLRPSNPDHLWLTSSVLDWPNDDNEGQIQDVDGKSFFDVDPSLLASPNADGDMRLVPMLQIIIPGTPDNLPSEDFRNQFGIAVQQIDATTQAAYVPLQVVTDRIGSTNVAFGGTMFYRAAATWSEPQQINLIWMVQGLLDQCQTVEDGICTEYLLNQEQVVHVYDDSWYLTGLLVTEEHDAQIAVVNEDPAETALVEAGYDRPFYVDALYGLTHGLSQTFLGPADCESLDANGECVGDGELDVTVDEIVRRFDHATNDSVSVEDRWNLPDVFDVMKVQNESIDLATMQIAVTETVGILESRFTPVWSAQQPVTPTLLFATQHQFRGLNLDQGFLDSQTGSSAQVNWNGRNLSLSLPQSGENANPVITSNAIKWAPYEYDPASGWQAADVTELWDEMNSWLSSEFSDISDSDEAKTYQTMAQMLYLTAYQGFGQTVMVGDRIVTSPQQSDDGSLAGTLASMTGEFLAKLTELYYDYTFELQMIAQQLNPSLFGVSPTEITLVIQSDISMSKDVAIALTKLAPLKQKYENGQPVLNDAGEPVYQKSSSGAIWGAAVFFAILLLYTAIIILEAKDLGGTAGKVVKIAALVLRILIGVMGTLYLMLEVVRIATIASAASSFATFWSAMTVKVTTVSVVIAVIGLIISVGISLGIFFHLWASNKIEPGTVAFNYALGYTLASIIVAVVIFLLIVFAGPIGALLVMIVGLIDIWASVFGAKWSITGLLTEWIAGLIYQYELQEKVTVNTGVVQIDLARPGDGMIAGNQLIVTLPITTALEAKEGGRDELSSNSFVYTLSRGAETLSTSRGDRKQDWVLQGDKATLVDSPSVTTTLTVGVNFRPISLTLNSAYALRGQSCWIGICEAKFIKGSSSKLIGYSIVLDVFPPTLDEFVAVDGWGTGGLLFVDRDGDGLLPFELGGVDPDDTTWDADGDGLSDAYEIGVRSQSAANGGLNLDPLSADTDGDTIPDGLELRLGSNPGSADSDGDGLSDAEELQPFGGWMLPYAPDKSTRVWSDPLSADADRDGLSDLFERTQNTCPDCDPWADPADPVVYNPRVWNPNPVPLYVEDNTGDGFVAPGATVVYTTTTANNLSGGQELVGRLSLSPSGGFSGAPVAADVAVSSGQSQSLVTVLQAGTQAGTFTLESQMALTDFAVTVWTMQRTVTHSPATFDGDNAQSIASATPTGWQAPYLVVTLERTPDGVETIAAYTTRANSQLLDAAVLYTGSVTSTLTAPGVGCASDGHCLAVWGENDESGNGRIVGAQMLNSVANSTQLDLWSEDGSTVATPSVGSNGSDFLVAWLAQSGAGSQVWVQSQLDDTSVEVTPHSLAGPSAGISSVTTAWNGVYYDVIWSDSGQLQRAQVDSQGQLVNAAVPIGAGSGWPTSSGNEQAPVLVFDARSQQSLLLYRGTQSGVTLSGLRLSPATVAGTITLDSAAALGGNDTAVALCADPVNGGWVASWSQPGVAEVLFQPLAPDGTLRGVRNIQVSQNENPTLALACSEPREVLALDFEEPASSTYFADSSGYGYDFFCTGEFCPLAGVDGRFGNGVNFDGLNDKLSQDFPQSGAAFTTDLWLSTTKQSAEILVRQDEFERIYLNNGNLCAWIQETSGADIICTSGSNFADGVWHHVAHVSDGNTHQIYVNGELEVTSGQLGDLETCSNCVDFTLGVSSHGPAYQGRMDSVHYHDRALTGAEVEDIFEGALAVYELDEVAGSTTFADASNNGFTATCSGDGCPTLGVEGMAYTAAQFDGEQDALVVAPVSQVDAIYAYDFDGATTVGVPEEWSPKSTQTNFFRNDKPEEFLGFFDNTTATLDLSNLPPHDTIEISFDLYLIGAWDGNRSRTGVDNAGGLIIGPDFWSFGYGTTELLRSTFALSPEPGTYQSYPGPAPASVSGITLYSDNNCKDRETLITKDTPRLNRDVQGDDTVGNDSASCYKFPGGKNTAAAFYEDYNYGGKVWLQDPKAGIAESGWKDEVSSVTVWATGNAPGYGATSDTLKVGGTQLRSSIYRITKTFSHTDSSVQFYFTGDTAGDSRGSFGLDNVVVKVKSEKSSIPLTNSSFTVSAWAKRESSGTEDYILSQGTSAANVGLHFGFRSNNRFTCAFWSNDLNTTDTYTDNEWHHWACTYDAATRQRTIYRDGIQVAQDTATANFSGFGPTYIGAFLNGSRFFGGVLDEVAIWPTALNAGQIGELYAKVKAQDETVMVGLSPEVSAQPELGLSSFTLRETTTELGATRQSVSRMITIDDDAPTAAILSPSPGEYVQGNGMLSISGSASDPTSYVRQVAVRINDGGWQTATGAEAWTINQDSGTLSEGTVRVTVQAMDAVGNTSSAATQSFVVDRTPPTFTVNESGVLQPTRNQDGDWLVRLTGTVADPNAGTQPGSGVAGLEVALQADAPLAGNGWQQATVEGTTWSLDYQLPPLGSISPNGVYTLTLKARDAVNNTTDAASSVRRITLDVAGPVITLNTPATTTTVISTALTLSGQATDVDKVVGIEVNLTPAEQLAALNGAILHLPLDESGPTEYFADQSGANNAAVCDGVQCPLAGAVGQRDQGLLFGGDQRLLVNGLALAESSFTLSAWVKRQQAGANDYIFAQGSDAANQGLLFGFRDSNVFTCAFQNNDLNTSGTYTDNEWHHWACTYDAATGQRTIYRDGVQVAQDTASAQYAGSGSFYIGARSDGTNQFAGTLDEIIVHERALAAYEVNNLYQYGLGSWESATTNGEINPSWTYAIPEGEAGLEGIFQVNVRGRDALGNVTPLSGQRVWRGEIDTRAPQMTFVATVDNSGAVPSVTYDCVAKDYNLVQEQSCQLVAPATVPVYRPSDLTLTTYDQENQWYLAQIGDISRLYRIEATRAYSGTLADDLQLQSCDRYGRCNTVAASETPAAASTMGVEILEPSSGTALSSENGDLQASSTAVVAAVGVPFKFRGDAHARSGLHTVFVTVNDDVAHSQTWEESSPPANSQWEFEWTPPAEGIYVFRPLVAGRNEGYIAFLPTIRNGATTHIAERRQPAADSTYLPTIHSGSNNVMASAEPHVDANVENSIATHADGAVEEAVKLPTFGEGSNDDAAGVEAASAQSVNTVEEFLESYGGVAGTPTVIYVDNTPPTIEISTTQVIRILGLKETLVPIWGEAKDNVKLARVDISINGGPWRHARVGPLGLWGVIWRPDTLLDDQTIEITARATDAAGHTSFAQQSIHVDMAAPVLGEASVLYEDSTGALQPAVPGETLTSPAALILRWTAASDGSNNLHYHVGFSDSVSVSTDALSSYAEPGEHRFPISGPGQWYAHVTVVDGAGNAVRDVLGPFIIK